MDPRALRPWTFQIDAYGAAAVAFGVLCGADFELPVGSAVPVGSTVPVAAQPTGRQ